MRERTARGICKMNQEMGRGELGKREGGEKLRTKRPPAGQEKEKPREHESL